MIYLLFGLLVIVGRSDSIVEVIRHNCHLATPFKITFKVRETNYHFQSHVHSERAPSPSPTSLVGQAFSNYFQWAKLFALFNEKTGTQTECNDFCSKKGGSLPAILSDAENTQLMWQLLHYDVTTTWIDTYQWSSDISRLHSRFHLRLQISRASYLYVSLTLNVRLIRSRDLRLVNGIVNGVAR
eukprot:sb/3471471/